MAIPTLSSEPEIDTRSGGKDVFGGITINELSGGGVVIVFTIKSGKRPYQWLIPAFQMHRYDEYLTMLAGSDKKLREEVETRLVPAVSNLLNR